MEKGLVESREKAKRMIMAGLVDVDRVRIDKPGYAVASSSSIALKESHPPYVSRGGFKLEAALKVFPVDVKAKILMDVGASTGGFTDCLLQHGAERVIALDVGYGQLHWKLRKDPRVVVLEKTNARYIVPDDFVEAIDGAVIDCSFISLKLLIPPVSECLKRHAFMIALIKPQFEVGREQVGRGGVVRDPILHRQVINDLNRFFELSGWSVDGHTPSPILGPKGNREFLVHLVR